MTNFFKLNYSQVRDMSPATAEKCLLETLAERATVTAGGAILRWSEYNENPDPLINRMLAKLLVDKMDQKWFEGLDWDEVVVISIENSAAYLAVELAFEVMRAFALDRPLRIVRARKVAADSTTSPAMNSKRAMVEVNPITADGGARYLVASLPAKNDFRHIKAAIVADDFRATGSTLRGGVVLAQQLFKPQRIIPVAAMGKSWQETEVGSLTPGVEHPLTALDVKYWWDDRDMCSKISINNLQPMVMQLVNQKDFAK
jgi:adenine/guanine phosphoribosyltransferase-like PRPP-binding protein